MGLNLTPQFPITSCPVCPTPEPVCNPCDTKLPIPRVDIKELTPEIEFAASGAPTGYIQRYLSEAAIMLARDLRVLKRKVTMDIQAGVRDYFPRPEKDERWHQLLSICICNQCVQLDNPPCCDTPCKCGLGKFGWFETSQSQINLSWTPKEDIAGGITVEMLAVPKKSACTLDEWFTEVHGYAIQQKALELIRADKGDNKEPHGWYEPSLAQLHRARYIEAISRHKIDTAISTNAFRTNAPS